MNEIVFFGFFILFIIGMLLLDLGVFNKKNHIVSFKEAAIWSSVWVGIAIAFYFLLQYQGHLIHGIENYEDLVRVVKLYYQGNDEIIAQNKDFSTSLQKYQSIMALEFITGYLLEYSLSVDNIFVIIMILTSFGVREKYYKVVLLWGILGAIVMRFIFIFLGAALLHQFHWIIYLFGGFLIYTGYKMFKEEEEEAIDIDKHPVVKFLSKYFSVFNRYIGDRFFILKNGKLMITPLFLVVCVIEVTDLIFAVDSVPAIFSITQDPYIVFFSNIFAIMGLRSMFFFLSNIMHFFHYLKAGLSFLLIFIGLKMLTYEWLLKPIGFESHYFLYIIIGILGISIIASLLFPPKKEKKLIIDEEEKKKEEKEVIP